MSETTKKQTVRVRIAVAVAVDGDYEATGWSYGTGSPHERDALTADKAAGLLGEAADSPDVRITYVEADVPVPVRATVEGVCDE